MAVRGTHRVVGDGMVEQVLRMDRGDLEAHRDRQLLPNGQGGHRAARLQESERSY